MSQTRRIVVGDGCALNVRIDGDPGAPAVLLSNSLGATTEMWAPQVAPFAERLRVIRYDSRGHGGSDVPPGAYGLDRLVRDALEILDALEIERVSFCGVSMGGMVGQRLAWTAPERVDRLVLANTSAFMGPPSGWQARIEAVQAGGMAAIAEPLLARWFSPAFHAARPDAVDAALRMILSCPPTGYVGSCAAIRDMDQRATARLIRAPTLVIAGALDPATPPDHARFLADAIPHADYAELDAAHLSNLEQSAAFTSVALDWLTAAVSKPQAQASAPAPS